MLKHLTLLAVIFTFITSCSKQANTPAASKETKLTVAPPDTVHTTSPTPSATSDFVKYTIPQGNQYCDKNGFEQVSYEQLTFKVKFDSSAIYQTVLPSNQNDINKLFGFSDNNAPHHDFSARFGWRWSNNALRLFAYVYNNGAMTAKEIGSVQIGAENSCSIKISGNKYIFSLNEIIVEMPRESLTAKGDGYRLYPYFGGDEMAPHAIFIWIKEG